MTQSIWLFVYKNEIERRKWRQKAQLLRFFLSLYFGNPDSTLSRIFGGLTVFCQRVPKIQAVLGLAPCYGLVKKKFAIRFYLQKDRHFPLRDFSWNFGHLALRDVFYIQKARHFVKSKTICVTFFYIQKAWHFALRNFHGIFEICGGGGIFMNKRQCTLRYIFICKKQCTLCCVFIYKESDTLCHIFICKKQSTLRYVYIYIIYGILYSGT